MTSSHRAEGHDPMAAAAHWCMRLHDGDMRDAEWTAFEAWHDGDGHPALLQRAIAAWRISGTIANQPEIIPLRAAALKTYHAANRARWGGVPRQRGRWHAGMAAALALTMAAGWAIVAPRGEALATGVGELRVASLADRSRVALDASTELGVRLADDAREVDLKQGRARFDVARDPLRPFRVMAGDKMIVAIGTSFSVELVGNEVRVILYEGQVEIRDRDDRAVRDGGVRQVLAPGQQLVETIGSPAPATVSPADDAQSRAWEQSMLSFEDETLARAAERMNRYADRKLRLGDQAVGRFSVDGEFEAGNVDAFVEGIAAVHDLRVTRTDREIVISRK